LYNSSVRRRLAAARFHSAHSSTKQRLLAAIKPVEF